MYKVLLFTSQGIGNDVFAYLNARKDVDLYVVTQRTKRDEIYGYRSTLELCMQEKVPVLTPNTFDEAFLSEVSKIAPDIIVCAYYPRIFPLNLIRIPPLGCINVHPGLLPNYRGTFPTPWCILNNEKEFGITIHVMDSQIDTGDILVQRRYPIKENETGHELYRRAMKLYGDLLIENFDKILRQEIQPYPQPLGGSYYNRIDPQYRIDWHHHCQHILNQIRVHAKPYFPAYSFLYNKCVLINKASFYQNDSYQSQGAGIIYKVMEDMKFVVSCADGRLLVENYDLFPILTPDDIKHHIRVHNRFS